MATIVCGSAKNLRFSQLELRYSKLYLSKLFQVVSITNYEKELISEDDFRRICHLENDLHTNSSIHVHLVDKLLHIVTLLPQIKPSKGKMDLTPYHKAYPSESTTGGPKKKEDPKKLITIAAHMVKRPIIIKFFTEWLRDSHELVFCFDVLNLINFSHLFLLLF